MDVTSQTDDGYLYVFMHLPKTGGTTVNAHLAEHLGFDDRFAHLGPWGNQARDAAGTPQPDEWPQNKRNRLKVVSGHRVHATVDRLVQDKPVRYFTILRDPAALAVSQYNHDASRVGDPPGFWEWYETQDPNPQLGWCEHRLGVAGLSEVTKALDEFWFVGVTERLDVDLPLIFAAIGVPPTWTNRRVAGGGADLAGVWPPIEDEPIVKHQTLTDEIRDGVAEKDRKDRRLHKYARGRRRGHQWD